MSAPFTACTSPAREPRVKASPPPGTAAGPEVRVRDLRPKGD